MLNVIFEIVLALRDFFSIVVLIFLCVTNRKGTFGTQKNMKYLLVLSIVLFVFMVIKIILDIILANKNVFIDIGLLLLYACSILEIKS